MRFNLYIDCDNAAFSDCPDGEIARILTDAARRMLGPEGGPYNRLKLRDANGNTVGEVTWQDVKWRDTAGRGPS